MNRVLLAAACAGLMAGLAVAEPPKSGIPAGEKMKAFNSLNVTGPDAGDSRCQIWKNGSNPVAAVFAREITPGLTSLVKKLDEACEANKDKRLGSFVVLLAEDKDAAEKTLKELAEKEGLKKVVLAVESPAGPRGYTLAKDADVTVLLYVKQTVKKNMVFEKGKLDDKAAGEVATAVADILPEKK